MMIDPSIPSEAQEQAAFVQYMRLKHPDILIFAIPNGGSRNKAEASRMKAGGVVAGIPDLFVPEYKLFIEMKRRKGGSVSQRQKWIMFELRRVGYRCEVCKGSDEAIALMKEVIHDK